MASSTNSDVQETSYVAMQDIDASLVGLHCQVDYCNMLDFLPFQCQSCSKAFCRDHRTKSAHGCSKAGAWAERKRLAELAKPSVGQGKAVRDHISQKPCAATGCETVIATGLNPGAHCRTCNRDYCLKHRLEDDHDCKNQVRVGAAPAQAEVVERARSALERLRVWGAAKKEQAEKALSKTKRSAAAHLAAVAQLKKTAKGRKDIPEDKRIHLYVEAEAGKAGAKVPRGAFFYSKDWVVGRMLDEAAQGLEIQNRNNRSSDEDRLRVFHVEGGRVLEFGEKVGIALWSGDTVVLLRVIGAPANLIEA